MKIIISDHAKERIKIYNLTENAVKEIVKKPREIVEGYEGRLIAQEGINEHILRVGYTKQGEEVRVITVYPAKKERYRRKK